MMYQDAAEYSFVENYIDFIEEKNKFEDLCTITDIDFIRLVMELQNKKEKITMTNKHFVEFLEMGYFERVVGVSDSLLKRAYTKTFPMSKPNFTLVHTISQNLVEFDSQKNVCREKYEIKNLSARIFAEGGVELDIVNPGLIFSDKKTVKVQLKDNDYAQELISYLN